MAEEPHTGGGASSPNEAGRFCRSLAHCGVAVEPALVEAEAAVDVGLRAALHAYGRLRLRIESDLPHLDDLLLCDEDSPAASQLADMLAAARQMEHLLRLQAREAAELQARLNDAMVAAQRLGEQAALQTLNPRP